VKRDVWVAESVINFKPNNYYYDAPGRSVVCSSYCSGNYIS